jgi:hypothetical protein
MELDKVEKHEKEREKVLSPLRKEDGRSLRNFEAGKDYRAKGAWVRPKTSIEEDLGIGGGETKLPYKDEMEQAFGTDLSHVKAHVSKEATEALNAEAFAVGSQVVFEQHTPPKETVAHEVAHVVQQNEGISTKTTEGAGLSEVEHEADAAAKAVVAGRKPEVMKKAKTSGVYKKEKLPQGKEGFQKMWEAHPHNYQDNPDENTSSADILENLGFPAGWNTCAIRLSIMLNRLGLKITPEKCRAAGLRRKPMFSKKTKEYYILSAEEMWIYLTKNFRAPDLVLPKTGRYKDSDDFRKAFEDTIRPIIRNKKGIVAFDRIFGYSGSGHMDIFDGEKLSDAPAWYPCQRIRLWYVAVE